MSKPELVTIEHDYRCVYVLGSPYARKTLLPHVKRLHRFDYLVGDTKPNFPVPALADTNTVLALSYLAPRERGVYAWDQIWRDKVTTIPFV